MSDLILITFLAGVCGIGLGGVLGVFFGGKSVKSEAILLSFSAGTMLSLVCFELLTEAAESGGTYLAAFASLFGALAVGCLDYIIDKRTKHRNDFITCEDCEHEYANDEKHEHCDHGERHDHGHIHAHVHAHHHKKASRLQLFVAGVVMALAIAIHNIPEGMSVGAVYAKSGGMSAALLVLVTGIVLHNIPEGMAVSVPLVTSGVNKARAVLIAAASGIPTIAGAAIGYAIGDMGEAGLTLSLGFAAGSLLYVIFGEVLPQSINLYCSRKTAFAAIAGVIAGMLILGVHVH